MSEIKLGGQSWPLERLLTSMKLDGTWGRALETFARREGVRGIAAASGATVTDDALQGAVDAFRAGHGLHRAEDTERWMAHVGVTLEDLEHHCESLLLERQLLDGIGAEQVEAYFSQNRARFDRVQVDVIEVGSEDLARELALQLDEEEATFEELVAAHSAHASQSAGGALGWVGRDAVGDEAAAKLFTAEPGSVHGPFASASAFRLYRVAEVSIAALDDELTPVVRRQLLEQQVRDYLTGAG